MKLNSINLFHATLLSGAFLACGGGDKKGSSTIPGISNSDQLTIPKLDQSLCDTGSKRVEQFDLNGDGRPDEWKLYTSVDNNGTSLETITCKQADLDYDGKKDYVITYALTGEVIAEEFDFDFDGRFDSREHFDKKTGKRFLIERDSDFDKKPDIWEKYDANGNKESVRRDRNGDGKPDYWEQYKNGILVAMLFDNDYDSRVDAKEQATGIAPAEETGSTDAVGDETSPPVDEDSAPEAQTGTEE